MQQDSLPEKKPQDEKDVHARADGLRFQGSLMSGSGIALITTTAEGIITTFSPAAEAMLGYSADEIVGKCTPMRFHDANEVTTRVQATFPRSADGDNLTFRTFFQAVNRAQSPGRDEWTCVRNDGSTFPASVTVVELRDAGAHSVGFAEIIHDLTIQKKRDEQLTISERKFHVLAENIPGVIYLCNNDEDDSFIYLNDYIETITGYSAGSFMRGDVKFSDIIHADDKAHVLAATKAGRKSFHLTYRICSASGEWRWIRDTRAGIYEGDNRLMLEGFLQDITLQKKAEETLQKTADENLEAATLQLQEQNRRLDVFAHIISHNLRAPVKNIQALIDLVNDQSEINDYKLIHAKLKNVAKNLGETMNELMDTLKARTQPQADLTEVRFKEVLDKVVQSLEGELIVAEADVTFDFNEAPTIHYSKPYLESIFQNLLTNAIKYKSPDRKPQIHFRSYNVEHHLALQVTDNGQGIDMERFGDKIFGLHKTFHDHNEARGVGLFLVKTQVEALGGTISVSSEVDKGTTFTIKFSSPARPL